MSSILKEIALDFYQGNIGNANSKYFKALDELGKYEPFVKKVNEVFELQKNEDWVGMGDIFSEISQKN